VGLSPQVPFFFHPCFFCLCSVRSFLVATIVPTDKSKISVSCFFFRSNTCSSYTGSIFCRTIFPIQAAKNKNAVIEERALRIAVDLSALRPLTYVKPSFLSLPQTYLSRMCVNLRMLRIFRPHFAAVGIFAYTATLLAAY